MTFTAEPEERVLANPPESEKDIQGILDSLRMLRAHGGHGTIGLTMKEGRIYEIRTEITWRPKKSPE